ncbi:hypothetical protein LTR36_009094 [Oleoguttula mirabilis]|uniref:HD domain-containing protein n=1 Tax=Oleoguttula mirabilis TaxID=1507867 RepID=A0AAV9J6P8_9PEZI|nr:hypothetical protein LTR36_009094 [Oleoguttula mirabilis]
MSKTIQEHGWTAVPRSLEKLVASRKDKKPSAPVSVEDIAIPDSPLVQDIVKYAKENLSSETFNHSMRVYYYGQAITTQHFPEWRYSPETYLLTALLHDIGTTTKNQSSTRLSFEFQGGYISLDLLKSLKAELEQAEAVCETIIRHQDLGDTGNVTTLTAVTHFATVLDNAGLNAELVHEDTIKSVVAKYPRNGWTGCFAAVVRKECKLKPWANTSRIEGFAEMVEANKLMQPYD